MKRIINNFLYKDTYRSKNIVPSGFMKEDAFNVSPTVLSNIYFVCEKKNKKINKITYEVCATGTRNNIAASRFPGSIAIGTCVSQGRLPSSLYLRRELREPSYTRSLGGMKSGQVAGRRRVETKYRRISLGVVVGVLSSGRCEANFAEGGIIARNNRGGLTAD